MFKLLYNSTHFICQQDYAQNTSSQASIGHELRTSRCTSWIWEKAEEPEIKLPSYAGLQKKQGNSKNYLLLLHDYAKDFDCVDHNKLWNILDEMEILDYITCLLRNVYAGQEATVRTHGKTGWFQIGKAMYQNCILSPCLLSLYAEYIMRNAGLDEAQARIKVAGRNINNLRYADDTTLMAENK